MQKYFNVKSHLYENHCECVIYFNESFSIASYGNLGKNICNYFLSILSLVKNDNVKDKNHTYKNITMKPKSHYLHSST
jgi:hypothetical protein